MSFVFDISLLFILGSTFNYTKYFLVFCSRLKGFIRWTVQLLQASSTQAETVVNVLNRIHTTQLVLFGIANRQDSRTWCYFSRACINRIKSFYH